MRWIVYVCIRTVAVSVALMGTAQAGDPTPPSLCVPIEVAVRLAATGQFVIGEACGIGPEGILVGVVSIGQR